ncbi:MAG: methionine--tRNA ligase [Nanoarchaeota archaeon]|nr:methionine--tRNA ligase [Nanoarchaeota archaeon]MBU1270012.1 methionine--tRNA ligase [Nanoarchaeota archaeon]MBU1597319.1 methionine--tRNA ligase [Nanoarchaeota archaeon]MBU2443293.1 methionine--tRNA ligase [Nanoarchaeota archaeon]
MKEEKILVTSALPYVNNIPHLGTLICVLSADVYTRYLRLRKKNVVSVLGTDEHGTTAEVKALEEGITPKQLVDKYFKIHTEIYNWFGCDYDCYGRTSSKQNHEISQDIFLKLYKNGYIKEDELEQVYCKKCEKFLADRFVGGTCPHCKYEHARGDQCENCGKLLDAVELLNPKCSVCGLKPEIRKSKHLFIDLPKLEPELRKWIKKTEHNWSENAKTMAYGWLKEGIRPRCITRDLKWGVPVPLKGYEHKVFYSWFDAPIGYISITAEAKKDWRDWWHSKDVRLVQFMGKDNIPFHTIMFPAFLIGAKDNYTLLDSISVNEFLNYETGQFSKSRHQGVFGNDAKEIGIPADVWRYYLMINRPEKNDTQFLWDDFQEKLNNELVANIGNFVNRTITFTNRFFDGVAPKLLKKDLDLKNRYNDVAKLFDGIELKKGLKEIMNFSRTANQYFQENEPWKLIKEDKKKAENVIANLLLLTKDLSILIEPYLPETSREIQRQLNVKNLSWSDLGTGLSAGHKINKEKLLFTKLEDEEVKAFKEKFSGKKKPKESPFSKLNLKVAKVLDVKQHPNAEKLLVMQIDIGEKRQLVAGLKPYYSFDELKGKKIIVVSNLQPAKLRGEDSQGMLLAAQEGEKVGVLFVEKAKPGERVLIDGSKPGEKEITFNEFLEIKLEAKNGKAFFEGKVLKAGSEEVRVDKDLSGDIR